MTNLKGIDVSVYQGDIDWEKVAGQIGFAILRAGYGMFDFQKDPKFERNYKECKRLGIPVGVYHYSYAKTEGQAKREAEVMLKWLEGKSLELPVYFDIEDKSQQGLGKDLLTNMCISYCTVIENAGFWAGVYANKYWFSSLLNSEELGKRYTCWVAQYANECTYKGKYDIWQKSSEGKINGINGNVDIDIMYRDLISDVANSKKGKLEFQGEFLEHYVKWGENLTKIAKKYGTSIEQIVKDNHIANPNKIYTGQTLLIRKW